MQRGTTLNSQPPISGNWRPRSGKPGRSGPAILLLNYAVENNLPDAAACDGAREGYLAAMAGDRTPAGNWRYWGWNGRCLPPAVLPVSPAARWRTGFWLAKPNSPLPLTILAGKYRRRETDGNFPAGCAGLRLIEAAWRGDAVQGAQQQLARALEAMAAAPEGAPAVAAAQESIMPLLQLARQCRT